MAGGYPCCCNYGCPGLPILTGQLPLQLQVDVTDDTRPVHADLTSIGTLWELTATGIGILTDVLADGTSYSDPKLNSSGTFSCGSCVTPPTGSPSCWLSWKAGVTCVPPFGADPYCTSCIEVWQHDGAPGDPHIDGYGNWYLQASVGLIRFSGGNVGLQVQLREEIYDPFSGCINEVTVSSGCVDLGPAPITLPAYWDVDLCAAGTGSLFSDDGAGYAGRVRITPVY